MSEDPLTAKEGTATVPAGDESIPLAGGTEKDGQPAIPDVLPILAIREMVVFPGTVVPLTVRRESSLKLLDASLAESKIIGLVTQRDATKDDPAPEDLYSVGTAVAVLKLLRQPDETILIVVQALQRIAITKFILTHPFFKAQVRVLESIAPPSESKQWEAEIKTLRENALKIVEMSPDIPDQARAVLMNLTDGGQLADFLATNINVDVAQKQALLEELDVAKRVKAVQTHIAGQLEIAQIQQKLQKDLASQFSDAQRRTYLREQLKAIKRELGEDDTGTEVVQLRTRLEAANPPAEVLAQAERELKRLDLIPPASPEFSVIVSYVETLADLPWQKMSEDNLDLGEAQKILDRDHYGLEKVKRRLIEYLAVRKLNPQGRGPILCFLGPPGVGKTSLGQSIADALGRKFSRMSLGGIRDEAEIRGHRRTYIGSMPGRLIQELRRVGTRNPVLMLDEIDKIGADFRGDPASALLEVLDPRQNSTFVDHYLDVPFDLSQVIFIATANYMDPVPPALRDRMEVIEIPGYTESEKLQIARRYLLPRQLSENGLKPEQCQWDDLSLKRIVSDYTHEAGVRDLERQIGAVCRGVAAEIARGQQQSVVVTPDVITTLLGAPRFVREERLKTDVPGVVTGLAYTPAGGEVLHIEAIKYPGKGGITLTGQIGNVMKESVQAALSLLRGRAQALGINANAFADTDIHVHVPAGAIPKDGPSAGVAMYTALASLFTNRRVRPEVGMTGEITLRGLVLPIGGLKEKSLAAMRAGLSIVIIPKMNEKDLPDIPAEARQTLRFLPVETVDEVLANALVESASTPG
ncbi:MAG: endopeptidase La [Terrimicrobiaceae bacterium]